MARAISSWVPGGKRRTASRACSRSLVMGIVLGIRAGGIKGLQKNPARRTLLDPLRPAPDLGEIRQLAQDRVAARRLEQRQDAFEHGVDRRGRVADVEVERVEAMTHVQLGIVVRAAAAKRL